MILTPRDHVYSSETETEGKMMRNNSETETAETAETLTIYQERNAQIEKTCQKYGLYSSENETNQYQIEKNSYEPPLQVNVNSQIIINH